MAGLTYRNQEDERLDKAQQEKLLAALDASSTSLRRDECGAWIIRGKHGRISTWGDGERKGFVVYTCPASTVDPEGSPRAWAAAKRKLAFLQVIQEGDFDGVLRIAGFPAEKEAETLREVLGIHKRPETLPGSMGHRFTAKRID